MLARADISKVPFTVRELTIPKLELDMSCKVAPESIVTFHRAMAFKLEMAKIELP